MWSAVAPCDVDSAAPSARSKHSATLIGDHVYLFGGRNGNLPMKDLWKYNLVTGKWQQLKPNGDKLPCLQEHSAVVYRDNIYVFGGEVGFSAGTETPLWAYDIKNNSWKKIRPRKGVSTPKGRRGHSALVHRGTMLIYGGYQDLKGSCGELWAYHFETESWHLVSRNPTKPTNSDSYPPPRHKHSAVLHDDALWIYGGMTDLQERSDLWKWDLVSATWSNVKTKVNPGPLHSHAASRLPSCMVIFGGEREGHPTNELWKFNFGSELWEKVTISGLKPQPRAESVAFTVSELVLRDKSASCLENRANRTRLRTCSSADRGSRHSSYLPNNKISPYEQTFVFNPSDTNYTDGSDLVNQYLDNGNWASPNNKGTNFLQEITKLSQLHITKINNKCSYTVLTGNNTDSTESLLKQNASPGIEYEEFEFSTPTRGTMIKSKSAYVIKKKFNTDMLPVSTDVKTSTQKKKVDFDCSVKSMPREPISVPNFNLLTLPTPGLTPIEATRLVYLDTEEENYHYDDEFAIPYQNVTQVRPFNDSKNDVRRGESYNSHLAYADNPLYQHMVNSNSMKIHNYAVPEISDISSTSDYCSLETVNRLSSSSNYSVKATTPQEETNKTKNRENSEGKFGFCNPNYMGPDIKTILNNTHDGKREFSKIINTPDSLLDDSNSNVSDTEDTLEMQHYNGMITKDTKVLYKHRIRSNRHVENKSLRLKGGKSRASSASRVERNCLKTERNNVEAEPLTDSDGFIPLYIFIFGGKEQGQVTVFQRPISVWKLKMF